LGGVNKPIYYLSCGVG